MYLKDKLKEARIEKKLTQKELADMLTKKGCKTSHATISNWELDISRPDIDTLALLCQILEKDGNYFFGGNEISHTNIDLSQLTEDELEEVKRYIDYLISKRNK